MIITLITDFGLKDHYAASMKGVILSINPGAYIMDISHLVSPGNITEGAYIFKNAYCSFPERTIHVGVVDPGVGGKRKGLIIEAGRHIFIGPDNGLFYPAAQQEGIKRVFAIIPEKVNKDISSTFHGRDIFAPVAAYLSMGRKPEEFGSPIDGMEGISADKIVKDGSGVSGEAAFVDSFGNIITNIDKALLSDMGKPEDILVKIKGKRIKGLRATYSEAQEGELIALISSSGTLEVAVNLGHAASRLKAKAGDKVFVSRNEK